MDLSALMLSNHELRLTPMFLAILAILYKIDKRLYKIEILQGIRNESGDRVSHNTITGEPQ
jgi:Fe2+ or Zn2+ uptake regulation protein